MCAVSSNAGYPDRWRPGSDDGVGLYTAPIGTSSGPTDAMDETGLSVDPTMPVNTFTITDGACEYRLNNLMGHRTGGAAGWADFYADPNEQAFQNWFWYRSTNDTREYALGNQVSAQVSGNHARLLYSEPVGDGVSADALLFDLEYTVTDLGADRGAEPPICARCAVVIAASVRNHVDAPVTVEFFSYNDMDLRNGASGDNAVIAGAENQAQLLFQPQNASQNSVGAVYKVSSTGKTGWEIAAYPGIRGRLDNTVLDDLANAGSPFGPGDYTGAQQWSIPLAPAGSVLPQDIWLGSMALEVTVFRDGDVDGDCDVDLFDHAFTQESFTGPMP